MRPIVRLYARQWVSVLKRSETKDWNVASDRFLRKVRSRGHHGLLSQIQSAVETIVSVRPVVPVEIISAHALGAEEQQHIVERTIGDKPHTISATVDAALLGGVIVRTPNEQWDFSVKHQLERLQRSIVDA